MAIVTGTDADDIIDNADGVTNDADFISGLGGNDLIFGLEGNDQIFGVAGNDTLHGGPGADILFGGSSRDTVSYVGSPAGVTINLETGTGAGGDADGDTLFDIENIVGSERDDSLTGDAVANLIDGSRGNDFLDGGAGDDDLRGGLGNDTIIGREDHDVLDGADGNDFLFGGSGNDQLRGGDGHDSLLGEVGNDFVDGGAGNDNIEGREGRDELDGGDGSDIMEGGAGEDSLRGGAGNDSVDGGEDGDNVDGGDGDDAVDGALGDDTVNGGDGNDRVSGGSGNDSLKGGGGADELRGGSGFDIADYTLATAGVFISLAAGTGLGDEAEGDILIDIEGLDGSGFADELTGHDAANLLRGNGGDDTLSGLGGDDNLAGGDGNDFLDGGTGADLLDGGGGDDIYIVDNAGDVADEFDGPNTGIDTVQSTVSFSFVDELHAKGTFENLTLLGSASIDGTGNALANLIIGNAGANLLDGRGGADALCGLAGNDSYVVDNAGDLVDEGADGSSGIDQVLAEVSFSLSDPAQVKGAIENLTLAGNADINGTGNDLANVIVGNTGANLLNGGSANDTLTGGAGADRFMFDTALNKKTNVDTITDFSPVDDTIVLDNAVFTKLKKEGVLKDKAFHDGRKAHDGNDRVIYNEKNGKLIYDKNGDDKGGAVKVAQLAEGLDLGKADFLVI